MTYKIPYPPLDFELETKAILKKTAAARSALAEVKGVAKSIPNESILIRTLSLQEAKDSSAIENIITTHNELFRSDYLKKHLSKQKIWNDNHYINTGLFNLLQNVSNL
ncbi:MAG: Fic/DOC family N-terminal domain-containing protein [Chitinophagales bacterium]|nr:hypothetical protein [Cytophagaceae bacterium]MDW8394463.1 Fic/DOC family N-terminal domain-containing protein [Chitinophagales bacterium]MDW8457291.1 Fic/DOC family N-terminal domain-containing protein [Cytophagaceae bacterium]